MPKVTLLSEPWKNYNLIHGVASYEFWGGEPREDIPVPVALICARKKDKNGDCMFRVSELPEVVEHACVVPKSSNTVQQNVVVARQSIAFIQPKLMGSEVCL